MKNDSKNRTSPEKTQVTSDKYLQDVTIGERKPRNSTIHLAASDPAWPAKYRTLAARVRLALGDKVVLLEHVGSTAVEGLPAKPIIDMLLVVPNSADENAYVPALEEHGFLLRIREPEWFEHRMLKSTDIQANLHVFSEGCEEIEHMLSFRDRLRSNKGDRELYEQRKRELAARTWRHTQHYADAKSEVIRAILARADL